METSDQIIRAIKMVADKVALIKVLNSNRETLKYGSGFIVSDGVVLTCHHVIMDKQATHTISVTFHGDSYDGEIDDINSRYDLATIQIPKKGLVPVKFGETRLIEPGQQIISIGWPFQLKTSTEGIISCEPHDLKVAGEIIYLQHSSVIEDGSSGGPLIDLKGNVLGVNFYSFKPGFTFSIPSEYVKEFIARAEEKRLDIAVDVCLFRRYLGLCLVQIPVALIEEKRYRGKIPKLVKNLVEVSQVWVDSPAEKSGLSVGDVIAKVNKHRVNTVNEFREYMKDGGDVLEIYRANQVLSLILN